MSDTGVIENMRDFSESKSNQVHIMKEDFIGWRNHFGAMLYFCQRIVGKERFSIPDLRDFEEIRFHEHQGYVKNHSFPVASYIARIESQERDIAELVKVLILIDTHNLLHNNADQLQIEIKEQIAKHIMEIGL